MTDLIDLNYYHRGVSSKKDSQSNDGFQEKKSIKICQIDEVIRKMLQRIDKNNIKTTQTYVFQIDCSRIKNQDVFYNSAVRIIGMISLINNIFSLRMQLFDVNGCKITARSTHHRTLISNFVFEVNAQLQNYKVQYNPVFGEFAFVFNFKGENIQQGLITELFQFGLHSYFQQCSAHFYLLSLIEFLNSDKNLYLQNVQEHLIYLKAWIKQRKLESKTFAERFQFYGMFLKSQSCRQKHQMKTAPSSLNICQIKSLEKYLITPPKKLQKEDEMSSIKIRHMYKKFKKYYNSEDIFALNLANRARYQNLIVVNTKNPKSLNEFFTTNRIAKSDDVDNLLKQNNLQKEIHQNKISSKINSYYQKQLNQQQQNSQSSSKSSKSSKGESGQLRLNICDKNTGKNYLLKLIHLGPQNVKNEFLVLQKFCKFESYFFFNQYIELENYSLAQQGYIIVNANPKRLTLRDFLRKNHKIMSFGSKVKICLSLVQILLTFHLKSKISNYFPLISVENLEITRNLLISFKTLSKYSIYPLFEVCNTISIIFFSKPVNQLKKNGKFYVDILKGDQIDNKYYGLSSGTTFLKYYLLQLHIDAIQMINIKQLKISKKISMENYPDIDAWSRQKVTRAFQQLLVIFSHYQSIFSKGNQQEFSFGDDQSDEDL